MEQGETKRQRIIAAARAWRDAERAHREEVDKYVTWEFGATVTPTTEDFLTDAAFARLAELREQASRAQDEYQRSISDP